MYADLQAEMDEGKLGHHPGAYLTCCSSCGEPGCWGVVTYVTEEDDCITWRVEPDGRGWYSLLFHFERKAYQKAMEKLEKFAIADKG